MDWDATYGIYFVTLGGGTIRGITNAGANLGNEIVGEQDSGEVYVREHHINAQRPNVRFTTEEVAAALASTGTLGVDLSSSNLTLWAQKRAAGGQFAAGAAHKGWKIWHGLLVPGNLRVDHRGNAALGYEGQITYDGSHDPVQFLSGQTLAAAGGAITRNTLGAVTVGGTALNQIMGIEVDFGVNVEAEGSDSETWDREATIRRVRPVITVRSSDPALGSLDIDGASGAVSIALQERVAGGRLTSGITITATGSFAVPDDLHQVSEQGSGVSTVMCYVDYDGVNAPLVVA